MKLAHAALATAALALAFALPGCGLESKRSNIWLQNNSDQTVILQMRTDAKPAFAVTAQPQSTQWSGGSPPEGHCYTNWEIVDNTGKVVRKIDRVCAYDTVVYP